MKKIIIFALLLVLVSFQLSAADKNYNLNDCISTALKNNFDLKLTDAQINSAEAGLMSAYSGYLPSLNYNMGYSRQLNPTGPKTTIINGLLIEIPGQDANSFSMGGYANLNIFDGFARETQVNTAELQVSVAKNNRQSYKQYVIYQTYQYYINLIRNEQILKIRTENINLGKAELERLQARHTAGLIPIANVYSKEADIGNRESDLIYAENEYEKSKSTLLTIMGLSPIEKVNFNTNDIPTEVSKTEISNFRKSLGSFSNMVTIAYEKRFDYKVSNENIEIAKESVKSAYSGYSPKISGNLGWSWSDTKFEDVTSNGRSYAGLSLNVPIFNNLRTNNMVQNAKLQLTQRELDIAKLEQTVKQNLQNALLNLQASEKQIEVTGKTVFSAQQNYDSMNERFILGAATITDITTANMQLITSQINKINAVYGYFSAQKQMLYAMGKIN